MKPKKTGGRANRPPVHSSHEFSGPEKPTGFALKDPKGYFILIQRVVAGGRVKEDFEPAVEPSPIDGYLADPVAGLGHYDLFLHRSVVAKGLWEVSNGLTGLRVSPEPLRNKADVARSAIERIHAKGCRAFWEAIHSQLSRYGASPRYKKEGV